MVAMRMSDVNGNEILATLGEPIDQILRMLDGQKRINEDGIVFAVNQRNGAGNPGQIFRAWRKSLSYTRTLLCQDLPIQVRHKIVPPLSAISKSFCEELDETGGDGGGIPARQIVARMRYQHRVDFWNPLLQ